MPPSSDSSDSSELSEEEYEVEKLLDKRYKKGVLQYQVRWVGYSPEDDSWEDKSRLSCPKLIAEFEREWKKTHPTKVAKRRTTRSKSRSMSQTSVSMDIDQAPSTSTKQKSATASKSSASSSTVKPTFDSNAAKASSTNPKATPSKAPSESKNSATAKTTKNIISSKISTPSSSKSSAAKEKTGTSKLYDKNNTGAREGMTRSQREFYESSADYFFISPYSHTSLFNNLVNKIEPSSTTNDINDTVVAPETMIKISEALSKNPPMMNVSELANSILSANASKTSSTLDKTVNPSAAGTTNDASQGSTTLTNDDTVMTTDDDTVMDVNASTSPVTNDVYNTTITSDETVTSANTEKEEDTINGQKRNAIKKGAAAPPLPANANVASPPPVTSKNKKSAEQQQKKNDGAENNHLWNIVATKNSGEAMYGIVEGRPLSTNKIVSEEPIPAKPLVLIPDNHKCFGASPTVYEFAKNADVHNVNNQKMEYVFSKIWKLRCIECTDKYTVNDRTVEYAYCLLKIHGSNCFMIKLNKCESQLFLIDCEKFKSLCPKKYGEFVCITREYFNTLGDLGLAIEDQREAVRTAFDNPLLAPYKTNGYVNFETLANFSAEVAKAMREIGRLFFLELQMAIGKHMCTVVDVSELHKFVMDFYEKRGPSFSIIRKEAVENIYETLFMSLVSEPADV